MLTLGPPWLKRAVGPAFFRGAALRDLQHFGGKLDIFARDIARDPEAMRAVPHATPKAAGEYELGLPGFNGECAVIDPNDRGVVVDLYFQAEQRGVGKSRWIEREFEREAVATQLLLSELEAAESAGQRRSIGNRERDRRRSWRGLRTSNRCDAVIARGQR